MSLNRLTSLLLRSATLQRDIDDEQKRCRPDTLRLLKLKKLRLKIKDQIQTMVARGKRPFSKAFS